MQLAQSLLYRRSTVNRFSYQCLTGVDLSFWVHLSYQFANDTLLVRRCQVLGSLAALFLCLFTRVRFSLVNFTASTRSQALAWECVLRRSSGAYNRSYQY